MTKIEHIAIFKCFQHSLGQTSEFEKLLRKSENIIFLTEIIPAVITIINECWYYSSDTRQLFITKKTNKSYFIFLINNYIKNYFFKRYAIKMKSKTFVAMNYFLKNKKNYEQLSSS